MSNLLNEYNPAATKTLKDFAGYQAWAGDYFPVIPLRNGKPCGSPHADYWYKTVTEARKDLWRADARDRAANGAAILMDSPHIKWSVCYVDVDDRSKLKKVLQTLTDELNIYYFVVVETGRGAHIYFLREAGYANQYTTGGTKYWGTFTKTDGKEADCVDLRGHGSMGIMPGSVYDKREKGGILSAYRWGGLFAVTEEPTVEKFLAALPVMPLAVWKKLSAKGTSSDGTELAIIEDADPRWQQVVPGLKVQACPWCGHKTFKPSRKRGAYACFHDDCRGNYPARIYVPASAMPKEHKDLEADVVISDWIAPSRKLGEDPVGWAIDQAHDILAEIPDRAQLGAIFPDGDPLKDWESEAHFAAALADKADLFDMPLGCAHGPTTFIATGNTQTRIAGSCFSFDCHECGPKMKELLRVALAASLCDDPKRLSNIKKEGIYIRKPFEASWASVNYETQAFNTLSKRLNRWASSHPGAGWLGLRPTPERAAVIAFGPPSSLEVWPLSEGAIGGLTPMGAAAEVSAEIDLEAWRAWVEEEKARRVCSGDTAGVRVKILLAPAELKSKVQALLDFLSGHNRNKYGGGARALIGQGWSRSPSACLKKSGEDYHTLTTYRTREVHKFFEEKTQTTLESKVIQRSSISRVEKIDLPCRAVPIQAAFVEANPSLHAHRSKKTVTKSSLSPSLLEN